MVESNEKYHSRIWTVCIIWFKVLEMRSPTPLIGKFFWIVRQIKNFRKNGFLIDSRVYLIHEKGLYGLWLFEKKSKSQKVEKCKDDFSQIYGIFQCVKPKLRIFKFKTNSVTLMVSLPKWEERHCQDCHAINI